MITCEINFYRIPTIKNISLILIHVCNVITLDTC